MIKILILCVLIVASLTFKTNEIHSQESWTWIGVNELTDQQKNVEQWVRSQIPALSEFNLGKVARLGDQLQFHYDGSSANQGWDVITNGGKGDSKFIQRATLITTEDGPNGTQIIKKKHIVRNDFIQSVNDYA